MYLVVVCMNGLDTIDGGALVSTCNIAYHTSYYIGLEKYHYD
jgi:hypothetical protein